MFVVSEDVCARVAVARGRLETAELCDRLRRSVECKKILEGVR